MLVSPDYVSNIVRVIGIDPGCTNLGLAIMEFDCSTLLPVRSEAMSFNAERMMDTDTSVLEIHSERAAKVLSHKQNISRILLAYNPAVVCCESPFYNRMRPGAYGALMEILSSITNAVIEYNTYTPFILYPPSIIKKSLGGSAFADKGLVRDQMLKLGDYFKLDGPYRLDQIDEHALDALAACYCYLENIKKGL